jgi:hypothetical protein
MSTTEAAKPEEGVYEKLKGFTYKVDAELRKTAPALVRSANDSFAAASKALADTLQALDSRTTGEQLATLKAYHAFLGQQDQMVTARMALLEKRKEEAAKPVPAS